MLVRIRVPYMGQVDLFKIIYIQLDRVQNNKNLRKKLLKRCKYERT